MTVAPDAAALHQLVDQIQPADYGIVYVILRRLATNAPLPLLIDEADLTAQDAELEFDQPGVARHAQISQPLSVLRLDGLNLEN